MMATQRQGQLQRKPSFNSDSSAGPNAALVKASPFGQMLEEVRNLAVSKSLWDDEMQRDLPKKWEKHGDLIVFPQNSFTHNNWRFIGRELWTVVAKSLKVARLGRKRQIDELRTPHVDLLFGTDGWVEHVDERGIRFQYDATKRVFNNSKKNEMKRISKWTCQGQTIIDMYTGIGYFALTFLAGCDAKSVVAVDWDDEILEGLIRSAQINGVDDRLVALQGDCRRVTPNFVADRVYLGLLPSCKAHWLAACKALKVEGGVLHINDIIDSFSVVKPSPAPATPTVVAAPVKKVEKLAKQKTLSSLSSVDEENHIGDGDKKGQEVPSTPAKKTVTGKVKKTKAQDDPKSDTESPSRKSSTVKPKEKNVETPVKEAVEADAGTSETSENGEEKPKRKFSRSASIVEEMENRVLPAAKVWKEYEDGEWSTLKDYHKEYALDVAQNCVRFLNNIHLSDAMYGVTVLSLTRYGEVSTKKEHVVLDLLCLPQDASVEHLASKFTTTNLSS